MPVTQTAYPILAHFLCSVYSNTGMPPVPPAPTSQDDTSTTTAVPKALPKGVVLGADGKPCRSCTSFASWASMTKSQTQTPTTTTTPPAVSTTPLSQPADCPPDVEALGRSSWTLLHSIAASYPSQPTTTQQSDTRTFIRLFGKMYPCWVCAGDFQKWMSEKGNEPRVSSRDEFGTWMCEAHNAVNVKLGKETFDCGKWEERWRTGWRDGSCG